MDFTQKTGSRALLETGLMFIPAIPAYLWIWPNVEGRSQAIWQSLTYVYVLVGTLFIGLRHYRLGEMGVNTSGFWLSLISGLIIIAGRTLVILSIDWGLRTPQFGLLGLLGEAFFYFILVGIGEELLFRGLIYRALEDIGRTRWAIWGSSIAFMFWHFFGQGPLVGAAMLFYGLIFAIIRWRAGGILGLILVHGMIDYTALLMLPDMNVVDLGRPDIPYPGLMMIGLGLLVFLPIYLWRFYPAHHRFH